MKKGFTIAEMLGVFVLLSIITLIAVPAILKMSNEYEYDTFIESAKGVLTAAETFYAENEYENFPVGGIKIDDIRLNLKNKDQFESGIIFYDESTQKFELQLVSNGTYCASGSKDNLQITEGNCETDASCFDFQNNTILKYHFDNEKCSNVIKIPKRINGKQVTTIGPYAFVEIEEEKYCSSDNFATRTLREYSYEETANEVCLLKSLVNGDNYDSKLKTITFPSTLQVIDKNAFIGSSISLLNLEEATNLVEIGNAAFMGTINLKQVILPKSNSFQKFGNYAFNSSSLEDIDFKRVMYLRHIGDNAFSNTLLNNIDLSISSQINYIGPYAFYKIQSNSVDLSLDSKLLVNTLGINAFCETNYNILGTYEFNSSIPANTLASACIN